MNIHNNKRPQPLQHYINDSEFEVIEQAARGGSYPPSMKDYCYMFCVFLFFFREIQQLKRRLLALEPNDVE